MSDTGKILYEYYLNKGEIRQSICMIVSEQSISRGTILYQYVRKGIYGSRFIKKEELESIQNNHVCSFEDDIEKFRKLFEKHIEANIIKLQQQVERNQEILKKLKSEK